MYKASFCAVCAVFAASFAAVNAHAHIEYYDLNQGQQIRDLTLAGKAIAGNDIPLSNPQFWSSAYQIVTASGETWTSLGGSFASGTWGYSVRVINLDSAAWTDGLRNNPTGGSFLLGDTHRLQFANFHLSQQSMVTIRIADDFADSGFGLNPSFSLYRGLAVFQAHDESLVDPLNPRSSTAPFGKIQNTKDTGVVIDSQAITSAFRDTVGNSGTYEGQFNALGGWSIANPAGDWSAVEFLAFATGTVNPDGTWIGNANESSLINYVLPAGDYTIAFGGNAAPVNYISARSGDAVANLSATLSFSAVAVPEPAISPDPASTVPEPHTWMSMMIGSVLIAGLGRRRAHTRMKHGRSGLGVNPVK